MNKSLELRNDDVLQNSYFSGDQKEAFKDKSPFHWFLEADKPFAYYNYPCTLAVVADGLDVYVEWVEYIKKHLDRFKIELHGLDHAEYGKVPEDVGLYELDLAKKKIEDCFGQKITTWYVPFGRRNIPEWGHRVCKKLGIKMDVPTMKQLPYFWEKEPKRSQINFHYWDEKQIKQIANILKKICTTQK